MKKRVLPFFFLFAVPAVHAQSFLQKDQVITLGSSLNIFKIDEYDHTANQRSDGDAAAYKLEARYEYGLLPWLGAGIAAGATNYITQPDSASGADPKATGFHFLANVNGHFARGEKADFMLNTGIGYATFKYDNRMSGTSANTLEGGGLTYEVNLASRFYFGESPLAIGFHVGYAAYSYKKLADKNNSLFDLKSAGPSFGASLNFRLRAGG